MVEGSVRVEQNDRSSCVEATKRNSMEEASGKVSQGARSSSWIVDMERLLEDANPSVEMVRWKKTSIYRVPEWIKDLTNKKAYRSWLVSLGPFHHGEPNLLPMEEHKRRAMLHLVKRTGKPLKEFVATIEEVVGQLQEAYQGLDDKWCRDGNGRFVEMMVTDGCFLLEVMRVDTGEADDDYAPNDPVFSMHGLYCLFGAIRADMLVLEDQLPLLVLKRLLAVRDDKALLSLLSNNVLFNRGQSDGKINDLVYGFLEWRTKFEGKDKLALHPLDLFHSGFCSVQQQDEECSLKEKQEEECYKPNEDVSIATAVELREAGIHFKPSKTTKLDDIDFNNGVLTLPQVNIHEGSEKEFLNLMVFEQLHCEAGSDVTNYLVFMDQLIDSKRDVALLRDKGIIDNLNDKEVAYLFNTLNKGGTPNLTDKALCMQKRMWKHYKKSRNRWGAFFMYNYLRNPWVFISLVTAVIVVFATLLQTIYSLLDFYTK